MPLAVAMAKCTLLHMRGLVTPEAIAQSGADTLRSILTDDKLTKQIHSAAKRVATTKKRAVPEDFEIKVKKAPKNETHEETEQEAEARLTLPSSNISIEKLQAKTIETNRAPLFLAFAVTVAKYTLPDLPLSSRLSVAQAATSAGAQAKAKAIGMVTTTAEDEGWTQGQPRLRLMGRDIAVMRRQVYTSAVGGQPGHAATLDSPIMPREAFWGIDLEALRKSNTSAVGGRAQGGSQPPIYRPESARNYLLKSVDVVEDDEAGDEHGGPSGIKREETTTRAIQKLRGTATVDIKQRRENASATLLQCIDYICQSWSDAVSPGELDLKAVSWYMRVRPPILDGKAGWGQKGRVKLQDILSLAKAVPGPMRPN